MNNFQLVTVGELSRRPAIARNQLAIEFHSYAIRLHAELSKERGYGQNGIELAVLTINGELHSAAAARKALGLVGLSKLIQPSSLINRFRYFQASGLAYGLESSIQIFSHEGEQSSREQRRSPNSLPAVNSETFALLDFGAELSH